MKLVLEVPFMDLENLKAHPFVAEHYDKLVDDFHKAHAEFMSREVLDENAEHELSRFKTDLFSSFIAGMLWVFNPEGKCHKVFMPEKKEKSSLILP